MRSPHRIFEQNRPASPEEVTYALKVSTFASVVGLFMFSVACYLTYHVFSDIVPVSKLHPWLAGTLLLLVVWLALDLALLLRRPSTSELIRVWAPTARGILLGTDAVVVASIWLFLPYADQPMLLMMMIFYACHIPTQVLCSPENTEINRVGIVAVLGSAAAFLLMYGGELERIVAVFLIVFGVLIYFMSDIIRNSVRGAVTARLISEATSEDLTRALAAVAEERDAKTRFIAAASHDLGQPLQAANLFFDQVMRSPDEASRARAAQGVQRAFAAADQLLSHMLNHLRLEADAVDPHFSVIDLDQCFCRLRTQHQPLAHENGIELRLAGTNRKAFLDPPLLDRAIGNLLNNAIIHSGATKVLLCARETPARKLRIYVIDDGVGIGSADAKHVFQDFYRGSGSKAVTKGGFGLGLSSVRRIAELMGGAATLDRRWIRGAAFCLEFPAFEAHAEARHAPRTAP